MEDERSLSLLKLMVNEGLFPSPEEEEKRKIIVEKLKTIVVAWAKKVAWQRCLPKQQIAATSATILTYGSYGLGVHDPESDIDALCVGPFFATIAEDFFIVLHNILKSRPEISEIHCVKDSKVPLMRFTFDGISVDLPYAQLKVLNVPENVDILNLSLLTNIDETSWKSLSGVRANQRILLLVPNLKNFQSMLRCLKLWAKRRGVYGNLNGFLGGVHLAVLAAFVCQNQPNASVIALISNFFSTYAMWPWPTPVMLQDGMLSNVEDVIETRFYMPIRLPCSPYEYCHSNVTKSTFTKIRAEFLRGHSMNRDLLKLKLDFDAGRIFEPFPYSTNYTRFVKIYLSAPDQDELGDWVGWVKSHFRCLLLKLEAVQGFCAVSILQNMTSLTEIWLHGNSLTGPLPDLSGMISLEDLSLRDNSLTGVVPPSLVNISTLRAVNFTNNKLQGPTPKFDDRVSVDMNPGTNNFCLDKPGVACDATVDVLLSVAKNFGYPASLADFWKGNDPCSSNTWKGIACVGKDILVINLKKAGLTGTISSDFFLISTLQELFLSDNMLTGTIPDELTNLSDLTILDVSNNRLYGNIPKFRNNVQVEYAGNPDIGKNGSVYSPPGTPGTAPGSPSGTVGESDGSGNKNLATGKIAGSVIGVVCGLCMVGLGIFFYNRKQKRSSKVQSPNMMIIHPRHSGDQDAVKITVAGSSANIGAESFTDSVGSSDIHLVRTENMVISIQVLRNVTNNFSEENILGRGGFGTVYKGELHDGTKIAVKRMESGVVSEKGIAEFMSEIAVLTKVRHRHLVALIGYCLDGNERLLVYEYMPQGTLSRHLFCWKEEGVKSLDWTRRLTIGLDVARGVEYLHGLAHQCFIHRDLKPSNILLGDDMRAKVADFGLVRPAPEGNTSIETRLAGTFGYLAPEYAVTGRVTTKVDVFSFGVILMEMITGRKALDETQPEDSLHLVTWFLRMHINKDTFRKAIDPTINLDEETLGSISTVAELAGHCTAREPYQRPDMGHVVNVLSSLIEIWKAAEQDSDDLYGIDFETPLPEVLLKWQAFDGSSSSFLSSGDNTQTSIPTRPSGFAESFTSEDGR